MKNRIEMAGATSVGLIAGIFIGAAIMFSVTYFLPMSTDKAINEVSSEAEKKPLYWVAPMDANYQRDKPGKSPMGMDLIPVYADNGGGDDDAGPGTIRVSPDVINNLGVRTAFAKNQSLHSEIKTIGYVKYDEDQLFHMHPRVEGWIETLYVTAAGDPVKEGQPLYEIYSPELVNAQEEYLLALSRKNKRLIQAAEDRLRALQLPSSFIKQIRKIMKVEQTITVFAPKGGVVDNLNIREGFYVKPGTTVMSIGTLDQVWVEAEVFERQVFQVSTGLPVTMTLDFLPGKSWKGKVDYIYPTLNEKTRTVKLRLRFDNKSNELKPNMFAQVTIHTRGDEKPLVIPREAVIRTGSSDRIVLALGEGRFKSIEVNVGRYDKDFTEILTGLSVGDRVVTSAQFLLDSESSKTSDFKRMNHGDEVSAMQEGSPEKVPENITTMTAINDTAWTEATINSLMPGHRMINVDHDAIDTWGWSDMTMSFTVADTIDYSTLKVGMTLHIEIEKGENFKYTIVGVHIPDNQMLDHSE